MKVTSYIKKHGLKRICTVLWRYKLPRLQIKLVAALTRSRPLENKILIESHNDFDCNGGALYDYLIENGYNKSLKIVWRLNHPLNRELPENVEAVPIYGPSWRKAWHVCTAKWTTADCVIEEKVRDDQVSLYMTHGVFGLKNFKGLLNLGDSADVVLSPSPDMDPVFRDMRSITSFKTKLVHLGYPSLDRLYAGRHSLGYEQRHKDRATTFLWMPTFRQGIAYNRNDVDDPYPYGIPLVENTGTLEALFGFLKKIDARVVIKLHPKQDLSVLSHDDLTILSERIEFLTGEDMLSANFDTYDLMLESDALITDYSGAFFEYVALDRPTCFITSDIKRYKIGLVPNAERYMPGRKVDSLEDLMAFIEDTCNGLDECSSQRKDFRNWFYACNDDGSSERVAGYLGLMHV